MALGLAIFLGLSYFIQRSFAYNISSDRTQLQNDSDISFAEMAPVIWGLDLAEFKWSKFKSSYMFGNKDYHLRRTKFVVYQLALIFCVVSESLGTAVLSGESSILPCGEDVCSGKCLLYADDYAL